MNTYKIYLSLECAYEVDANNESEAIEQAIEWFSECEPTVDVDLITDDEGE